MHSLGAKTRAVLPWVAGLALLLGACGAGAQAPGAAPAAAPAQSPATPPAAAAHPADDLEPAVNTSDTSARAVATTAASAPAAAAGVPPASTAGGAKSGKGGKAMDRLELDTTQITGNRELPKVLYIVPWKRSDLGDLVGKPANSLLDEVLQPVDRDVFKRENRYYRAVMPKEDASAAPAASGGR